MFLMMRASVPTGIRLTLAILRASFHTGSYNIALRLKLNFIHLSDPDHAAITARTDEACGFHDPGCTPGSIPAAFQGLTCKNGSKPAF